jgi:hypothetical protein
MMPQNRERLMTIIAAMPLFLLLLCEAVHAQTISIVTNDDTESIMVQAGIKRALIEQGYTVKNDAHEGIVLMLSVMTAKSNNGIPLGVVGHMSVVMRQWQQLAEMIAFAKCKKKDQATAQYIQDYLGIPMTYLHASMAVGATEHVVANALSKDAIRVIRQTESKLQIFFTELNQRIEQSERGDVIKPMR